MGAPMEGPSGSPKSRMPAHLRDIVGERHVRPVLLPTICEHKEFHQDEDYLRTLVCNLKLINTRWCTPNYHTKLIQRFEEDEGSEEELPLLSDCNTQAIEKWKPKGGKVWKMPKKGVKIAWLSSSRRQWRFRASLKVLSPFFLLRRLRDAYVRALNNVGMKFNHGAWNAVGARAM